MAMAAKAFNKPVYVAAESFKFSNLYPLNQRDIPNEYSVSCTALDKKTCAYHPTVFVVVFRHAVISRLKVLFFPG